MATFAILNFPEAAIAQLGERQTEDLKVPGSILGLGIAWTGLLDMANGAVRSTLTH